MMRYVKIYHPIMQTFDVIHLCGKGNLDESLENIKGYTQFEYVTEGLPDLLAASRFRCFSCRIERDFRIAGTSKSQCYLFRFPLHKVGAIKY